LRFLEEFNLRETAAILGKDVSHIKVIQSRALAKLRKDLEHGELRIAVSFPRAEDASQVLST
jgi:DNA-directed RNA polymerase specialized sigma24 family protein